MLWWAYCKEQIWLGLPGHPINELHLAPMMWVFLMFKTEHPEPLKHPPAVYILDKCDKVRQENTYS